MINYVAGFLFSPDRKRVALIRKNKPEWQKGRLNGIGGKVEEGESAIDAMVREFREETGAGIARWDHFAFLEGPDWQVTFFRGFADPLLESTTDEMVAWYPIAKLEKLPVINNLRWLIPLALDDSETGATHSEIFYAK